MTHDSVLNGSVLDDGVIGGSAFDDSVLAAARRRRQCARGQLDRQQRLDGNVHGGSVLDDSVRAKMVSLVTRSAAEPLLA